MPAVAVLRTYEDQAKGLYLAVFFQKNAPVDERGPEMKVKSINWIYQDDMRKSQSAKISEFSQDFLSAYLYSPGVSHSRGVNRQVSP